MEDYISVDLLAQQPLEENEELHSCEINIRMCLQNCD